MAKRTTIEIASQDMIELETIARSTKAESRQVQRAKIILDWHKGKSFVAFWGPTAQGRPPRSDFGRGSR